ncbi:protein of unknown function [Actinopolyspora xinjiangensis]|uniref:DUF4328 domain-containing protein n=1 Tax=Actinopolyspora xinjiangensis TaxID=405564 RepID=A0A1H0X017_9ACTN|nr:DUF4328 domain-containing protein [Actinopolyspora xinjiangensis]SDP96035.1 protein of unknown function [Actinopolyspora xinjiangensis]
MTSHPPASGRPAEWTATPPGGPPPPRRRRTRRPYTGPPSYPAPPRWGFPPLAWRWPLALPTNSRADPAERITSLSVTTVATLWITAVLGCAAAGAELWRYVLLLHSRSGALNGTVLAVSDALVATAGIMTWLFGVLGGVFGVLWALRARSHAHNRAGLLPARRDWQVVAGFVVPGLNLFVPGSALAELEHATLRGLGEADRRTRPAPSRLVGLWWGGWCASLLLGWGTLLWGLRDSAQALADGVLLHAASDVALTVVAVLSALVVKRITRLLVPVDPTASRPVLVRRVTGAPAPPRAPRPPHAVR